MKQTIAQMARGRTTLVVVHRRSMRTDVDRVLVLRDRAIEQDETPHQLMQVEGYFRQMMLANEGE